MARRPHIACILLGSLWACPNPHPDNACEASRECDAGAVCMDGTCRQICRADRQCGVGETCSTEGVCLEKRGGMAPVITSVDGTGSSDNAVHHAAHHFNDRLRVGGANLLSAGMFLQNLETRRSYSLTSVDGGNDAEMAYLLPQDLVSGKYLLRAVNASGTSEAPIAILQGEPGNLNDIAGKQILTIINDTLDTDPGSHLRGTLRGDVTTFQLTADASGGAGRSIVVNGLALELAAVEASARSEAGVFVAFFDLSEHSVVEDPAPRSYGNAAGSDLVEALANADASQVVLLATAGDVSPLLGRIDVLTALRAYGASDRASQITAGQSYALIGQRTSGGLETFAGDDGLAHLASAAIDQSVLGCTRHAAAPLPLGQLDEGKMCSVKDGKINCTGQLPQPGQIGTISDSHIVDVVRAANFVTADQLPETPETLEDKRIGTKHLDKGLCQYSAASATITCDVTLPAFEMPVDGNLTADVVRSIIMSAGFVSSESDPSFAKAAAATITSTDVANWKASVIWGNHANAGYLKTESDTAALAALSVLGNRVTNLESLSSSIASANTSLTNLSNAVSNLQKDLDLDEAAFGRFEQDLVDHNATLARLSSDLRPFFPAIGTASVLRVSQHTATEAPACSGTNLGVVYFDKTSGNFRGCNGANYVDLDALKTATLGDKLKPAASCKAVLDAGIRQSGVYWLQPAGFSKFRAYCDMTTDGGGWTMCYTAGGQVNVDRETTYDSAKPYAQDGYRTNCLGIGFTDVVYVNHNDNRRHTFKQSTRAVLNDVMGSRVGSEFGTSVYVATNGRTYATFFLNACFNTGLFMSASSESSCASVGRGNLPPNYWDLAPAFRTAGAASGEWAGVAFAEHAGYTDANGGTPLPQKVISVGIR